MAKRVLIVENEGLIAGLLGKSLARKGYEVTVMGYSEIPSKARRRKASLVLIDAHPEASAMLDSCLSLRQATAAPIIALVEPPLNIDLDGVQCLNKPLDFRQLLTAVEGTLAHQAIPTKRAQKALRCADLVLDLRTRRLNKGELCHRLTPKEFALLRFFMTHRGQVVTHREIMRGVWQTDYTDDLRTLHVHVSWLRKKIEDNPKKPALLRTVRGVGYRFSDKG